MKYRLAIFDFDGTLADSGAWCLRRLDDLADEFGFRRLNPQDRAEFCRLDAMDCLRRLGAPLWRLPQMMKRIRDWGAEDAASIRPFAGVDQMLVELQAAGVRVGMVSSNAEANVRRILGSANAGRIDYYRCGASLMGKASKLRQVLRSSSVKASHAIYIGDEMRDGKAAREAGMAFGAVSWGYTPASALAEEKPELTFRDHAEIVRFLSGNR